jgi:hypothetical protein
MKTSRSPDFQNPLDILAPLSPTIAKSIVKILQSIVKQFLINFSHNCDDKVTELLVSIPLRQVPDRGYRYVSAIAHSLSSKYQLPPIVVANTLYTYATKLTPDPSHLWILGLSMDDRGYLYFDLSTMAIAQWLEYLHQDNAIPDRIAPAPLGGSLDLVMYARDRCQSMLRLAQSQKFIHLDRDWHLNAPTQLFISDYPQDGTLSGGLQPVLPSSYRGFEESTEQSLIRALMGILDSIHQDNGRDRSKLAIDLAEKWLEFHRYCRMWGDVKIHHPQTAIARLALTAIVGKYLELMLDGGVLATKVSDRFW